MKSYFKSPSDVYKRVWGAKSLLRSWKHEQYMLNNGSTLRPCYLYLQVVWAASLVPSPKWDISATAWSGKQSECFQKYSSFCQETSNSRPQTSPVSNGTGKFSRFRVGFLLKKQPLIENIPVILALSGITRDTVKLVPSSSSCFRRCCEFQSADMENACLW